MDISRTMSVPLMWLYLISMCQFQTANCQEIDIDGKLQHMEDIIKALQKQVQNLSEVSVKLQEQNSLQEKQYNEDILHLKAQFISQERTLHDVNVANKQQLDNILGLRTDLNKINSFVSFTAYATADRDYNVDDVVQFDGTVVNYGGYYNSSTGYFVCPYTGYYLFSVSILAEATFTMAVDIRVNGTMLVGAYGRDTETHDQGGVTTFAKCESGQQVWVRCRQDGNTMNGGTGRHSSFTGALLRVL